MANIGKRYNFENQILISFEVKVRVIYIEIESPSMLNFSITYLNEVDERFMHILDIERAQTYDTQHLSLNSPLYTKAIRIHKTQTENGTNITDIVKMIVVGGCPSAILNTGIADTVSEQWTMELSENVIKTSPYLHVVPISKSAIDPVTLFKDIETQFNKTYSMRFQLSEPQYDCEFSSESITKYVHESDLLFHIINISKLSTEESHDLIITIYIKSLNRHAFDRGMMSLNSTIELAIKNHECSSQQLSLTSDPPGKTSEASSSSNSNMWIIISISFIGILQVVTLLFLVVKQIRDSRTKTIGNYGLFLRNLLISI